MQKKKTGYLEGISKGTLAGTGSAQSGFDFEQFKRDLAEGIRLKKPMSGKAGLLAPLIKEVIEATLEGELDVHLAGEKEREDAPSNRRNGHTSKVVKGANGTFRLSTPRDRASTFEPQMVQKRQSWLDQEIEERILDLYCSGMSYRDISEHVERMYLVEVSPAAITAITDRVSERVEQWRQRPLERVYCVVWLDAIHYRIRSEQSGKVEARAVHCLLGIDQEGKKEVLGLYLAQGAESARFWSSVLEDLKRRGVEDILIACTDALKGFAEAIEYAFPQTDVQACVVHQVRASIKYIPYKESRSFVKDLKTIYQADSQQQAMIALEQVEAKWHKYPQALRGWRENFERLTSFLHYPEPIRRIVYTTNPIEAYHRQLRKVTKTKGAFVSEQALMKLLYVTTIRATERWSFSKQWPETRAAFYLIFKDRLETQTKL